MKWLIFTSFILLFSIASIPASIESDSLPVETDISTKVELGQKLFFDPILSLDQTISCASCHKPEFAFAA